MKKLTIWVQMILFLGFIGVAFVVNLALPDTEFSEVENRYLQQFPDFSFDEFVFGDFTTDFEKYTSDQFFMRDSWMTIKSATELATGKGENNDVYYCENETLIEEFVAPEAEKVVTDISYIEEFADNIDVPVYFAIIPGVAEIWSDLLPKNAPNDSQKDLIDEYYDRTTVETIDIYSVLNSKKDEYIFYRTDHHWTSLGAYYGYTAIADAFGFEANPIENYTREVVSNEFLGTTYSTSGFTWTSPDEIETFVPEYDGLKVVNYSTGVPADGSMYDYTYLEKKDKYAMFFGGVTPLLEIETGNTDKPSLLILRDSYTDSLSPFLLEHFSKISIIDLRYYNFPLSDYIVDNNIDNVLLCYSAANLAKDTNLYKLAN